MSSLQIDHSNSDTFLPLGQEADTQAKEVIIPQHEIIQVKERIIPYPCDRVEISPEDFKITDEHNEEDPRRPKTGEKLLQLYSLAPPIVVNLRKDASLTHPDTRELLTQSELEYLNSQAKTAVLFIHGFNLRYGGFSPQIIGLKENQSPVVREGALLFPESFFKQSPSLSTVCRTQAILEQQFNHAQPWPFKLMDEDINGHEAHNWFVHMEHNLNCAAEKFKKDDYTKLTRLVHIAWSGDVLLCNYLDAEEYADEAGKRLTNLLKQLEDSKIKIYVIAHSLGSRVLLSAMQHLSCTGFENSLEQVFLWQAALPNNALSNDPNRDYSIKNNCHFPEAHLASKKIMVLYSKNDWILHFYYYLINRLGVSPRQLLPYQEGWELLHRANDRSVLEMMTRASSLNQDAQIMKLVENSNDVSELADFSVQLLKDSYQTSDIDKAMGYYGVDTQDPFMRQLIEHGKLIQVNQVCLEGHSEMKIPTQTLMNSVYKAWIMHPRHGIKQFGR